WWFGGLVPLEELEDFGDVASLPGDNTEWRPVPGTDPMGWVRLSGLAWPPGRQMAYLATTIASDVEQPVAVRLGAAQVARAWLNGVEVLSTAQPLERSEDQVSGGGWLRKGENSLIVAVASEDERWWLRVRVTQPDGRALKGAQERGTPPVVEPAVNRPSPKIRDLRSEIELAVSEGAPGSSMALAAYLVAHQPDPVGAGSARTACQTARAESPGEARLLEWIVTTEPRVAQELTLPIGTGNAASWRRRVTYSSGTAEMSRWPRASSWTSTLCCGVRSSCPNSPASEERGRAACA
ncbi:MAG: hypothetical protein P8Y93_05745, partial [Acidobacteriota bacterium]